MVEEVGGLPRSASVPRPGHNKAAPPVWTRTARVAVPPSVPLTSATCRRTRSLEPTLSLPESERPTGAARRTRALVAAVPRPKSPRPQRASPGDNLWTLWERLNQGGRHGAAEAPTVSSGGQVSSLVPSRCPICAKRRDQRALRSGVLQGLRPPDGGFMPLGGLGTTRTYSMTDGLSRMRSASSFCCSSRARR